MRTGKMPPALARYWRTHKRGTSSRGNPDFTAPFFIVNQSGEFWTGAGWSQNFGSAQKYVSHLAAYKALERNNIIGASVVTEPPRKGGRYRANPRRRRSAHVSSETIDRIRRDYNSTIARELELWDGAQIPRDTARQIKRVFELQLRRLGLTETQAAGALEPGENPRGTAGEYVREEMQARGKRSQKQAIAIGLSRARRAGVKVPRKNPGPYETEARHISHGFYRVSAREAKELAGGALPRIGYEKKITIEGRPYWLARTVIMERGKPRQVWSLRYAGPAEWGPFPLKIRNPRAGTEIYPEVVAVLARKSPNEPHHCDAKCKRAGHLFEHRFKRGSAIYGDPSGRRLIIEKRR